MMMGNKRGFYTRKVYTLRFRRRALRGDQFTTKAPSLQLDYYGVPPCDSPADEVGRVAGCRNAVRIITSADDEIDAVEPTPGLGIARALRREVQV